MEIILFARNTCISFSWKFSLDFSFILICRLRKGDKNGRGKEVMGEMTKKKTKNMSSASTCTQIKFVLGRGEDWG